MIESLRIQNVAIVEEAELELGPGLNVLTGETGAGKSIVLGALSLLVGVRGSAALVRDGSEEAAVEVLLRTDGRESLERSLETLGLEPEEGASPGERQLVVRRTVSSAGRSRARVAGQMVPIATLSELFGAQVEISSQHSSQALRRSESHGRFLDAAGGHLPLRGAVERAFAALRVLDGQLASQRDESEEVARRVDFLAFQVAEIDEVGLQEGELEALDAEHSRLSNASQLQADGAGAVAALQGDPSAEGVAGACESLQGALRLVEGIERLDASVAPLVQRLRDLDSELGDVAGDLDRYVDGLEVDAGRLDQVEERLGQIERLRRKYGQSESEILAFRAESAAELEGIEGADERRSQLERERAAQLSALEAAGRALTEARQKAARKLSRRVQKSLRELAMPQATFGVDLERRPPEGGLPEGASCGPSGVELPEFRFSANAGEALQSLQKVASGGELSRVFLALQNALRSTEEARVLVFDEVDAGIGGEVAEKVGRSLADLARTHQVLCITHLPQIAAFADRHFRVKKNVRSGRTRTAVELLDGDDRIDEIARMAGGKSVSNATRKHAEELLRARGR